MPRAATVTVDEAIAVIVQFRSHFETNQLPIWSSEVWQGMSAALDGKWNKDCVYTNVTKNRRNILELAWQRMNIVVSRTQDHNNNWSLDETAVSESSNSSEESSEETYEVLKCSQGLETFDLILTEEEWTQIKPDGNSLSEDREQKISLRPRVWTNVVALAMWLQYRMPCAFVFKRADVSLSADEQTYTITIYGKCKSKKCGNIFDGTGIKNIRIRGLTVEVRTKDTRGKPHDVVKRPLNGEIRKKAQKEIISEGCAVWKKRRARELMRPGDVEPPILPNNAVIRQACKEGVDVELNVKKSDARDIIRTLEELSMDPEHCGVIHSVASRPFHVFYYAPAQLHAYKEYCRLNRDSSFICIDATGSVVKALDLLDGSKSGHIFLYSIVINFDGTTIAVNQMLSEQHDTEFIEFWLRRWIRAGAPKPKEAVCDYSRALLSALCLAFNNQTLQIYVRCCFSIILDPNIRFSQEQPATLLSVDVAHLIHLVCRWKCFKSLKHTCVKEFFVRCVALMVDCICFADFEKIFSLTCAVGMQRHEDAGLDITHASTTKEARKKLENLIATWGIQVDFNLKDDLNKRAKDRPESFTLNDLKEPTSCCETNIHRWINQEVTKATMTQSAGEDLNPFYLPDFVRNLTRLCLEFPLWTRVGRKNSNRRATSSYVESYFNYVKNQVFRNKKRPIRVDKFIKTHARDIAGATLLGSAKLLQLNIARCIHPSDGPQISKQVSKDVETPSSPREIIDSDLLSSEDWRRKAEPCDPMNLDSTPINWNIDSDLMSVGNQPPETTYTAEGSSVQVVENSADLDLNIDLVCSTPLEDKSQNNDLMLLALADHSYSKVEEITGLENLMDDACFGNTSTPPNRNLPLDQQNKSFTDLLKFKANTDASEQQKEDMLADNPNTYVADEPKPCTNAAPELQPENHPTERYQPGKTSKFFRPHPEVRHQNSNLSNNKKKAVLLANGLRCREVKLNGESFFVHRTCSFDSFAQILLTAAIDNNKYFTFIQSSTNRTFQLVLELTKKGVTQQTYLDRVLILKPFCPLTVKTSTEKRVISYLIDGELGIADVVEKVMKSEPSINNVVECSHCGHRTYSSVLMAPNHKTIGRLGFSRLQAALDFHSPIYNICCNNPCPGRYTLSRELNNHLFIELDIRPNLQATSGLKCKLRQMPTTLHLGQSAGITYEYRLVGIVAYEPGHYVAYCRRQKGCWEIYNDLSTDIRTCNLDSEIDPHLAVYVRTDNLN